MLPIINLNCRYPVMGGLLQRRGGTARHDAVAWGYARGADAAGVDIIQNCEVTGVRVENNTVIGVDTTRGFYRCWQGGFCCRRSQQCGGRDGRL